MNKAILFFGLSAVVALTGTVAACSSTTTTAVDTPTEGGSKEGGGPSDGGKDTSTPEDEDTGVPATGDKACAAMATLQECGNCCVKAHMTGYATFQKSLIGCACLGTGADSGTGPCATDCATSLCASPPAALTPTCNTCLKNAVGMTGQCQAKLQADCTADPDCLGEQMCVSPCQGKP